MDRPRQVSGHTPLGEHGAVEKNIIPLNPPLEKGGFAVAPLNKGDFMARTQPRHFSPFS